MIHSARLYPGVCASISPGGVVTYTAKFRKWAEDTLEGGYTVGIINDNAYCLIFDSQEDLVAYQLVWDNSSEHSAYITAYKAVTYFDVASFYCPYVPLTVTNISTPNQTGDTSD